MRAYSPTVGATDGSIIAAIITTHTPRNQPSAPSPVHGPPSIPPICRAVHHQPAPASAKSSAINPSCVRAAARACPRPSARPTSASSRAASNSSGSPGEGRAREPRLPLVLDPEGVDPRAGRLGDGELRPGRVEHPLEADSLARLDPERDDVLDLEVDDVADLHAVPDAVVDDLDRHPLDAEHLADERDEARHRPSELPAEDGRELVGLLAGCRLVDEHAELPVPFGHDLRRV